MEMDDLGLWVIECDCITVTPLKGSFGNIFKLSTVLFFTISYNQTCDIIYVARCGCVWVFLLNSGEKESEVDEE